MVNIDCDQKIRPRDRSQSHRPQRPRLSAVSMRPRTASLIRSPSRARVDCQWKAKPRISTTNPVVADSVIDSAASDPHSGSFFSWMTMTWPGSDLTSREIASAPLPFGSVMSLTMPCWPGAASNCAVLITSSTPSFSPRPFDRKARQHAMLDAGDDDMAAGGDAPGGNEFGQQALQPLDVGGAILPDRGEAIDAFGQAGR